VTKSAQAYVCFCGKVPDPAFNRSEVPHTCGEVCGREKKTVNPGAKIFTSFMNVRMSSGLYCKNMTIVTDDSHE
jgi:hypothetical protein